MHLQRGRDGMPGVFRVGHGRAPESHDGITDVLVERATLILNDGCHFTQVFVHELRQLFRFEPLGNAGEAPDVGKQHGQFGIAPFHAVVLGVAAHFLNQFGRNVLPKHACELPFGT